MILMPPMCGIFFLQQGVMTTGSDTVDPYAEKQGQVGCGLPEKPHGLRAEP